MASLDILGLHHVTAIAGRAQSNLDFYMGILGLRLVKRTVNYDDPATYHLYYGDDVGHPGTIMTFFPWPGARAGQRGTGQATVISFSIPPRAIPYWIDRLDDYGMTFEGPERRWDEEVLTVYDLDGLHLELVAHHDAADERFAWQRGPVPLDVAIRGLFGVTITVEGFATTSSLLLDTLGFQLVAESGNRFRYQVGYGPGAVLDVVCLPAGLPGRVETGTVHHVAWRVPDAAAQLAWHDRLVDTGLNVSPVLDRQYFRSIYFREPGGVLFELATDPPGFTWDEPVPRLGEDLMLPPWLENLRPQLVRQLPLLHMPEW
ncbi:MAG: ring-cleaving dioxygenase [Chloroflexi bacterium]|nr:ring-cleaving dioxygenase [Chloroflexota bacterium]